GATLTYIWREVQGPSFTFTGASTAKPAFIMSSFSQDTNAVFELVVSDGVQESAPSRTQYTLKANAVTGAVRITWQTISGGTFIVRATAPAGGSVVLESAADLSGSTWTSIGQLVPSSGSEIELRDGSPISKNQAFYRVRYVP